MTHKEEHQIEVRVSQGGPEGKSTGFGWTVFRREGSNGESVWKAIAFSGNTCHAKPIFASMEAAAMDGYAQAMMMTTAPILVKNEKGQTLDMDTATPTVKSAKEAPSVDYSGIYEDSMDGHGRRHGTPGGVTPL